MSKISELSDGGSLVSTDYLIAVRSGGNVKVRMDQINVDQVDLGDNEFIRLGNSQDLTLVHNASNSIINQAGIGDLLIQKAGSTKLTVNSTGIDVTGTVTTTGNVGIGTSTITSGFKMEVIGDARFGDVVGDDAVELGWSAGGSEGFIQVYDRGASAFRPLNINNSLKVDASGNVGIGTSSPSSIANYVILETQGDTTTTGGIYYSSSSDSSQKAHFYIGGGTGYLGTQTNHPLAFTTNNTERMRIDSNGVMSLTSVGTVAASAINNRNVSGDGGYYTQLGSNCSNTSSWFMTGAITGVGNKFYIYGNGDIVNTNNSYGAISDEKLKENIVDSSSQWDDIKALRVRKYSMKADNLDAPNMLGVIAQEVEAAGMGGLVYESPDIDSEHNDLGTVTKQVNYSILYMKAVKALQEAMDRIETLEAKVAALES
jgi:hypothetical protein